MSNESYIPLFHAADAMVALVVGAGVVAARRIAFLSGRGVGIIVVAPRISKTVKSLAREGAIRMHERRYRSADLDGATHVFAATGDPAVNAAVARDARRRKIPVNVADAPRDCTFIMPATVEAGELAIAVSTGGRHPGAARAVREFLEEHRASIAVRLERGRRRRNVGAQGTVYIVGAGPGDPDLLTVRALGLIRNAEVLVHDYLVPGEIVSLAPHDARKVCLHKGRTSGHGSRFRQATINDTLVSAAREGKVVVRLKSGDPFVFGRGGEEAEHLQAHGVPCEIVPGITAAIGCAASAALPLTHRDLSSSITLIAGHEAADKEGPPAGWDRLPVNGTVAVYMTVERLADVANRLLAGGFAAGTPAVMVENGTRRGERVVRGRLDRIAADARRAGVRSPAILFVGKSVAALHARRSAAKEHVHGSVAQGI